MSKNHPNTPTEIPTTITEEEAFQSTIQSIFDSSYSSLHDTIRQQVDTLPLTTDSGTEKLNHMICNIYDKYVDVTQSIVEHEIFTLEDCNLNSNWNLSKKKREKILKAYEKEVERRIGSSSNTSSANGGVGIGIGDGDGVGVGVGDGDGDHPIDHPNKNNHEKNQTKLEKNDDNNDTTSSTITKYTIPKSHSEIATKDEMNHLDEELMSLRRKLQQFKHQKKEIQSQLETIHQTTKPISNEMKKTIQSSTIASSNDDDNNGGNNHTSSNSSNTGVQKLQDSVNAAMIGKNGLEELCNTGQDIIQKLKDIKEDRDNGDNKDGNETKEFSERMKRAAKYARDKNHRKKTLTLEEDYEERKRKTTISSCNNGKGSSILTSNLLKK